MAVVVARLDDADVDSASDSLDVCEDFAVEDVREDPDCNVELDFDENVDTADEPEVVRILEETSLVVLAADVPGAGGDAELTGSRMRTVTRIMYENDVSLDMRDLLRVRIELSKSGSSVITPNVTRTCERFEEGGISPTIVWSSESKDSQSTEGSVLMETIVSLGDQKRSLNGTTTLSDRKYSTIEALAKTFKVKTTE